MNKNLYCLSFDALMACDINTKLIKTKLMHQLMQNNELSYDSLDSVVFINEPGRPEKPILKRFEDVPKRSNSHQGLIHTVHAITHIEFNAINIALDAIYRFRDLPKSYYQDWIQVAFEESIHFSLLSNYLLTLGYSYGDFDAHNGLWQMCLNTENSALERMALVPRVLEARGLDVTPNMRAKFLKHSKKEPKFLPMIEILDKIFNDEIKHVAIGNKWFSRLCDEQQLDSLIVFDQLIKTHIGNTLHGHFNIEARKKAGFTQLELDYLQERLLLDVH